MLPLLVIQPELGMAHWMFELAEPIYRHVVTYSER